MYRNFANQFCPKKKQDSNKSNDRIIQKNNINGWINDIFMILNGGVDKPVVFGHAENELWRVVFSKSLLFQKRPTVVKYAYDNNKNDNAKIVA